MIAPTINESECIGCETCIGDCPATVFAMEDGVAKVVNPNECIDCGQCVEGCPVGCISFG